MVEVLLCVDCGWTTTGVEGDNDGCEQCGGAELCGVGPASSVCEEEEVPG